MIVVVCLFAKIEAKSPQQKIAPKKISTLSTLLNKGGDNWCSVLVIEKVRDLYNVTDGRDTIWCQLAPGGEPMQAGSKKYFLLLVKTKSIEQSGIQATICQQL
ncbi:MAG: hypothetical protein WCX88_00385 [Patescibacteria group bacterium]